MDLKEYLNINQVPQVEFAKIIGVDQSTVSLYCNKKRIPTADILEKIVEATNSDVTYEDFITHNNPVVLIDEVNGGIRKISLRGGVIEISLKP